MAAENTHRDVMVSSTSRDLPDYRDKAKDAVLRASLFPRMMELDTAMNKNAVEYSLGLVDDAEAYVGIFAHRYGYIPPGSDISITEMEYRRARERGIPILIYLIDDDYNIPVSAKTKDIYFEDDDDKAAKLAALKDDLLREHVVGFFTTPIDLAGQIYEGLDKLKDDGFFAAPEPDAEPDDDPRAGKLPEAPAPFIAHDYILTRKFFGRKSELAIIDQWAASDDTVLIFNAIGGMGKSALTWHWLHEHAEEKMPGLDGVIWWSFYESDGSMENFIKHALAYVTDEKPSHYNPTPREERRRLLLDALKQKRYLLILDGFERVLVAYNHMDAPMRTDDTVDAEQQEAAEKSADEEAHLRSCTDPRHGDFVRALAACAPSKILVSTRLRPHELEDKTRQTLNGVDEHILRGIYPPEEALALLDFHGVRGDGQAIMHFTGQFGNHALLLNILAGLVINYRPAPGDFDAWNADEGADFRLSEIDLSQRRSHILTAALRNLTDEQERLLGYVAAFRYPVSYQALQALNPYLPPPPEVVNEPVDWRLGRLRRRLDAAEDDDEKAELQRDIEVEQAELAQAQQVYEDYQAAREAWEKSDAVKGARRDLNTALDALEDTGLLQWERDKNRYDLHPVVRGYVTERLSEEDRQAAYAGVRDHFQSLPEEDPEQVQEVDDLRRSLEIYFAFVNAGMLDAAAHFYRGGLSKVLLYELNAHQFVVELLRPLFPDGFVALPALQDANDQGYILNELGGALLWAGTKSRSNPDSTKP